MIHCRRHEHEENHFLFAIYWGFIAKYLLENIMFQTGLFAMPYKRNVLQNYDCLKFIDNALHKVCSFTKRKKNNFRKQ